MRFLAAAGLSFCLSFCLSPKVVAEPVAHREVLVTSAYQALPALLKYVQGLKQFRELSASDKDTFNRIVELANKRSIPLIFSEERAAFQLNPGEPERLMRSTAIQDTQTGKNIEDGEIYVNRPRLNTEAEPPALALILKLLFHEFGHKTKELNWGLRDRLAQLFENAIAPHIFVKNLKPGADLIVLSLPSAKIDKQLGPVKVNEPQPSNIVLLNLDGQYVDLTDNIHERAANTTSLLRAMWSELNRVIYAIYEQFAKVMMGAMGPLVDGFLKPFAQAFGQNFDESGFDDFKKGMDVDIKELRTLEIHDATSSTIHNGIFVSLRSTFSITRTEKLHMPIRVTGFPWRDSFPVPVMVHVVIPTGPGQKPEEAQVDVQIRPNADYMTTGKVLGITRHGGEIRSLKVRFKEEGKDPVERVGLLIHFGMGHLTLDSAKIEQLDGNVVEAHFEIPANFIPLNVASVVDSVLINSERTIFLDRMISLWDNENSTFVGRPKNENEFIEGSVGIWGLQNGKPTFRNHFTFKEPVWILDDVKSPNFSLSHSKLKVEFKLKREQKIREIRLYLKRSLMAVDITPQDGREAPQIATTEIEGKTIRFANGGGLAEQKDVHDITSISANEIYSAFQSDGIQKVQATLSVPFRMLDKVVGENQAYAPPMGYPYMVEVVTENLQTLRYYFQDPTVADTTDCEGVLNSVFGNNGSTPR